MAESSTVASEKNTPASFAKGQEGIASIKNFLKGVKFPPTTAEDRAKLKAAIEAYRAQIKKTLQTSASQANSRNNPASLLAAQTKTIKDAIASIKDYLPAGTNLDTTSFDAALKSMENTINKITELAKKPAVDSNTPPPPPGQPLPKPQVLPKGAIDNLPVKAMESTKPTSAQ
jgi:hypothetical protein